MKLRPCTIADIEDCANIFALACYDDPTWTFRCPYKEKYPDMWKELGLKEIKSRLEEPSMHGMVCVAERNDPHLLLNSQVSGTNSSSVAEGTILGYCWAERISSAPETDKWIKGRQTSFFDRFRWFGYRTRSWYARFIRANPVFSLENEKIYKEVAAQDHTFDAWHSLSHWMGLACAVHPRFQGAGVGGILMSWMAELTFINDDSVLLFFASPKGLPLYEKMGMKIIYNDSGPAVFGLPIDGPDTAMIWDPKDDETMKRYETFQRKRRLESKISVKL